MKKLLFFVFILFLFTISISNVRAGGPCTYTLTPGPDSDGKTLDDHTHSIDLVISEPNGILKSSNPDGYWVTFNVPNGGKNHLNNEIDNGLWDYASWWWQSKSMDSSIPTQPSDSDRGPAFVGTSVVHKDPWVVDRLLAYRAHCEDNIATRRCEIKINGIAGDGLINQGNKQFEEVFMAGTYGLNVVSTQNANTIICSATFEVKPTIDLGYNNCKINIHDETAAPDAPHSMNINKDIWIDAYIWSPHRDPFGNAKVNMRVLDSSGNAVLGGEGRDPVLNDIGVPNDAPNRDHIMDLKLGQIQTPGNYYFNIYYSGGAGGAAQSDNQCRRGPIYIGGNGEQGGAINGQGSYPCEVCPLHSSFDGISAADNKLFCKSTDKASGVDVGGQVTSTTIPCAENTICSHRATDPSASATSNPNIPQTTGCIPAGAECSGGSCGTIAPPPPMCSAFDNADPSKATKCKSLNVGLTGEGIPLPTDPGALLSTLLGIVLSIAGGIAVVLIMISGYKMMVSQGNPDQIKDAREQLTAAIVGLLFVIFSLVILQLIGVSILALPGFSK